jgi:hypothetical protein
VCLEYFYCLRGQKNNERGFALVHHPNVLLWLYVCISETVRASKALGGVCGHVVTTMTITLALSSLGGSLLSESAYRLFSSTLLTLLGGYYLYTYFFRGVRSSCCEPKDTPPVESASEHDSGNNEEDARAREPSTIALVHGHPTRSGGPRRGNIRHYTHRAVPVHWVHARATGACDTADQLDRGAGVGVGPGRYERSGHVQSHCGDVRRCGAARLWTGTPPREAHSWWRSHYSGRLDVPHIRKARSPRAWHDRGRREPDGRSDGAADGEGPHGWK